MQITAVSDNIQELENLLNRHVENIKNWLDANKLSINALKTEFRVLGSQSTCE